MSRVLLLVGVVVATVGAANNKKEAKELGVAADVKYILCDTCKAVVTSLHEQCAASPKRLDESGVQEIIDGVCDPTQDKGAWMGFLDMVESEDGRSISLERQLQDGPCDVECSTIKLACKALLEEGWENELQEALWEGARSAERLVATACSDWSSACKKPPPKVSKTRQVGETFRPYTDQERAEHDARMGKPTPPGMLSAREQRQSLGLRVEEEDTSVVKGGVPLVNEYLTVEQEKPAADMLRDSPAFTSHLVL